MSTSLLYHACALRGYHCVSTAYQGNDVVFNIEGFPNKRRCSACGSKEVIGRGQEERQFRNVPFGGKGTVLRLGIQRLECKTCTAVRQAELGFADPRRTYTRAFERCALGLLKHMTIKAVARYLKVSWDVIKDIQKRCLQKRYRHIKLKHLRRIGIDEISIGHGHKYLTIVLDIDSGEVVFVGDGKGSDALQPFWKRLRASRAKVEAVAMDMSEAYIGAVRKNLPKAAIVFDHFHVIKLYNDKLGALRRQLQNKAEVEGKRVLKGTRWLLLKNPENLKEERDERQRLDAALSLNQPLATAYYMKEDLRQLWSQHSKFRAVLFLDDWLLRARASGVDMLDRFAATLDAHRAGVLAYYDHPISNGPLEGTNNKIKTMQRQAYGFRDLEFYKLRILALHESRYELIG